MQGKNSNFVDLRWKAENALIFRRCTGLKIGDIRFWSIAQDSAQDHEISLFEESCRSDGSRK